MKPIIIDIPLEVKEDQWPLIVFLTKLSSEGRTYTGYKELSDFNIDVDEFLKITNTKINSRGAIKVDVKKVSHIIFDDFRKERYILDPEIFKYEWDLVKAFKEKDSTWFTPYEENCIYDEGLFNELPDELQKWFLRKLKKGITEPAQVLLEHTYKKYVLDGKPLLQWKPYMRPDNEKVAAND